MRLIDAEEAKKALMGWETDPTDEEIEITIDRIPTVDAKPVRHAHWIWKGDEGDSRFMCSECGGKEYVPTCMGIPNIWEYCPNCGARMEEYNGKVD